MDEEDEGLFRTNPDEHAKPQPVPVDLVPELLNQVDDLTVRMEQLTAIIDVMTKEAPGG